MLELLLQLTQLYFVKLMDNNPLKHAPHTVNSLMSDWDRPYSREVGCFPPGSFRIDKYWPPVGRVDNAYGDRHFICTCPSLDEYDQDVEKHTDRRVVVAKK